MKTRMMILVSIVALAMCAGPAGAVLLAYEPFNYSGTTLNAQNGGTGWAGPWATNAQLSDDDTSLNYVGANKTPNGDRVSHYGSYAKRQLATPLVLSTGNVYYISYLFKKTGTSWHALKLSNGNVATTDTAYRGWYTGINGGNDNYIGGGQDAPNLDYDGGHTVGDIAMVVSRLTAEPGHANPGYRHHYLFLESPDTVPIKEPAGEHIVDGLSDVLERRRRRRSR